MTEKIQLNVPKPMTSNILEVLKYFLTEHVLEMRKKFGSVVVFCSKETKRLMFKEEDSLRKFNQKSIKFYFYEDISCWNENVKKIPCGIFTTPFIDFDKIRDLFPESSNLDKDVIFSDKPGKDIFGDTVKNFVYYFVSETINLELYRQREKVLAKALIWYKDIDRVFSEPNENMFLIHSGLSLNKYIDLLSSGKYIYNIPYEELITHCSKCKSNFHALGGHCSHIKKNIRS